MNAPQRLDAKAAIPTEGLIVDNVGKSFRGRAVVKGVHESLILFAKHKGELLDLSAGIKE